MNGKAKKARVSKKAQTKHSARFDKSRQPGPEYVWHEGFDYVHKGLTIKVRGHWEKSAHIVKEQSKPKTSGKSDRNGLAELAVPVKKEKANAEAKAGEGDA